MQTAAAMVCKHLYSLSYLSTAQLRPPKNTDKEAVLDSSLASGISNSSTNSNNESW